MLAFNISHSAMFDAESARASVCNTDDEFCQLLDCLLAGFFKDQSRGTFLFLFTWLISVKENIALHLPVYHVFQCYESFWI